MFTTLKGIGMSLLSFPGGIVADRTVKKDEADVLYRTLQSLGIHAFSIESQFRLRLDVIWRRSSPKQRVAPMCLFLYRLSCVAAFFCCCAFLAEVSLIAAVPWFWLVYAIFFAAVALVCYAASVVKQLEVSCDSVSLSGYAQWEDVPLLPTEVWRMANSIRETCSQAMLTVIMLKVNGCVEDNFLFVKLGDAEYVIAKWRDGVN